MIATLAAAIGWLRARRPRWAWWLLAALATALAVVIWWAISWWRRSRAETLAHEAFIATTEARAHSQAAEAAADDVTVTELRARAADAQARADHAAARAATAEERHAQDRAAIARVRGWDDVGGAR